MIESKTFWRVKCDECGEWLNSEGYGYSVMESEEKLLGLLSDYEWVRDGDKHYHADCAPPHCDECDKYGHWDEDCPTLAGVSADGDGHA